MKEAMKSQQQTMICCYFLQESVHKHALLPFGFNLIIINPRQDLSGQDG